MAAPRFDYVAPATLEEAILALADGASGTRLMAGGISQALVTTALGLSAAIPLMLIHSLLNAKSRRLMTLLEEGLAKAAVGVTTIDEVLRVPFLLVGPSVPPMRDHEAARQWLSRHHEDLLQ